MIRKAFSEKKKSTVLRTILDLAEEYGECYIFYLLFWKTNFSSFCLLCVFCAMDFKFDVIFIELQHLYAIIVYVSAVWPSMIFF